MKRALVLLLIFCGSCSDFDLNRGKGKRKVEVDPIWRVGIFDGTYKASAVKHQQDSNGKEDTFHYNNLLVVFDQNGPSLRLDKLTLRPDEDSYTLASDYISLVWTPSFSYYSQVLYVGEGDRDALSVHSWGEDIDAAGVTFRSWEVQFTMEIGERFQGFGDEASFAGAMPCPLTWEIIAYDPDRGAGLGEVLCE